jgi:TolB-like protein/Tfp pilus assembly protein PilF
MNELLQCHHESLKRGKSMPRASPEAVSGTGRQQHRKFIFDDFELDLQRGCLSRRGQEIPLRPKTFAVLQFLLERAGELVPKEELLAAVWPGVVVTDDSVAQCLIELRRALGDTEHSMVRTVPRRGVIFEAPVRLEDGAAPGITERPSWIIRRGWIFAALLSAIVAILLLWPDARKSAAQPEEMMASPQAPNSIAVLRFSDLSPERNVAYLADGFSEEIMHILAQSPSLRVIARASSFAVEGQSIAAIARTLDVSHVLEGSVRKQGEKVRVTAQLIDATTSAHIWSRTYDRDLEDIFDVQRDIASSVAADLEIALADTDLATNVDPHAYQLFLEARYFHIRGKDGDLVRSKERYEAALEISPDYAPAWTGLSAVTGNLLVDGGIPEMNPAERKALQELNRHATQQALHYGPNLPEVHMRVARYHYFNGDNARAREHVEIARSIDPDHWLVRSAVVNELLYSGRIDESIALVYSNMQRDPLNMLVRQNLISFLIWAKRFEEAQHELNRILEMAPALVDQSRYLRRLQVRAQLLVGDFEAAAISAAALPDGHDRLPLLAIAFHGLGRQSESADALEKLIETAGENRDVVHIAEVLARRGESEQALDWLKRIDFEGTCEIDNLLADIHYSPFLAELDGIPSWEVYRSGILQLMQTCLLRLEIDSPL